LVRVDDEQRKWEMSGDKTALGGKGVVKGVKLGRVVSWKYQRHANVPGEVDLCIITGKKE
jgi:hypothetical protein